MASKSKFSIEGAQPKQRLAESAAFADASERSSTRQLVSRIAQALQIPEAVLYDKPNADVSSLRTDGTKDGLDVECAMLLQAYRRIDNLTIRHNFLSLVQQVAR